MTMTIGPSDHNNAPPTQAIETTEVVEIILNNKTVRLPAGRHDADSIKTAAMNQGVNIQIDFILRQENPGAPTTLVIEEIDIVANTRFIALAPDDNS